MNNNVNSMEKHTSIQFENVSLEHADTQSKVEEGYSTTEKSERHSPNLQQRLNKFANNQVHPDDVKVSNIVL